MEGKGDDQIFLGQFATGGILCQVWLYDHYWCRKLTEALLGNGRDRLVCKLLFGLLYMIDWRQKLKLGGYIHIDWTCDHYGVATETTLHVLHNCFMARRLWNQFLPSECHQPFFSLNLRDWLTLNLSSNRCMENGLTWSSAFGVAIWRLWFWWNQN